MRERYQKNLGALTEAECAQLQSKTIFVAGCGGLGGYVIDLLLRVGVGCIVCADGDVFEPTNLNRQLLCTQQTLGKNKAQTAADYARWVNPEVEVLAIPANLTVENASTLLEGCDAAIDALDSAEARRVLENACGALGIPMIHGAISGFFAQWGISLPGDHLMEQLYPAGSHGRGSSPSLSFTAAYCAARQVSACVCLLCGRPVESGRVFFDDLSQKLF